MIRFGLWPDNLKGATVLMVAALGFAIMIALIKLVGGRLPVTQILFVRQLGMVAILAPALARDFPDALATTRPRLQCLRVALALVAMMCGFTAVVHMPLADATALGFAKSFFVTIFAVAALGERVGPHRWSAVALGFVGVLVMMRPGSEGFTVYAVLAVVGAAAAGGVMVVIRLLTRTESGTTILAWQAIGVGIVMAGPALWWWVPPTPWEWVLLGGIGVVSYYAQKFNILAYRWGEASLLASLDYVRLLWATALGWWLFDTLPGTATWVGAGVIVAASIYTVHRERVRGRALAAGPHGRGYSNP